MTQTPTTVSFTFPVVGGTHTARVIADHGATLHVRIMRTLIADEAGSLVGEDHSILPEWVSGKGA